MSYISTCYSYIRIVYIIMMCPLIFTASCTVPVEPTNGTITATLVDGTTVDYDSLNETVLEGTVLTYQCDNGLTLFGSVNITCMGDGEWSSDPTCSGKC